MDLPIVGTVRSAKNRDDDCDKDARRDPVGAIATHKSSSAAPNQEPRVSGARPSLCPDTAKGRHPNLFAKTLLDDLPSNCIFPAPDTVHIRSAPGSQRKNYGKRPATDVHCCASSTSPSLTHHPQSAAIRVAATRSSCGGSACPRRGRWCGRRRSQGLPGPRPSYRSCRDHQWRRRRAPVSSSSGSIRRRPTSRPSSYIRSIA